MLLFKDVHDSLDPRLSVEDTCFVVLCRSSLVKTTFYGEFQTLEPLGFLFITLALSLDHLTFELLYPGVWLLLVRSEFSPAWASPKALLETFHLRVYLVLCLLIIENWASFRWATILTLNRLETCGLRILQSWLFWIAHCLQLLNRLIRWLSALLGILCVSFSLWLRNGTAITERLLLEIKCIFRFLVTSNLLHGLVLVVLALLGRRIISLDGVLVYLLSQVEMLCRLDSISRDLCHMIDLLLLLSGQHLTIY